MFLRRSLPLIAPLFFIFALAGFSSRAQEPPTLRPAATPTPSPREEQEPLRIFTEEVQLPVVANDDYGHFDPTLERDDILVLEDRVPQQVKSIRRIPASVLLVLGTGSEISSDIRAETTRDFALNLIEGLRPGDNISVIQFARNAELIQDWTTDKNQVTHTLRTKLFSGRGSHLSTALDAAIHQLENQPLGNRHVVLVTDGVDLPGHLDYQGAMRALSGDALERSRTELREAVKRLNEAQATVHVISYTTLVRQALAGNRGTTHVSPTHTQQSHPDMAAIVDPTMPPGMTRSSSVGVAINFDPQMSRLRKAYERATKRSEQQLTSLAEDMGGRIWLPANAEQMAAQGAEVARDIGAQYVVTYKPTRPLSEARAGEYRRIEVASHRVGLHLRSRRGYVITR
ncbi:MAG: hypothetical protein AUG51_01005 [Acidobacteria bacterium 13_1_20CM_3_53_8]|nr:MAG: hypothetical protein AUG51_01005 [Acidobacteria bacterium 13_1_20CM_3_53_8]